MKLVHWMSLSVALAAGLLPSTSTGALAAEPVPACDVSNPAFPCEMTCMSSSLWTEATTSCTCPEYRDAALPDHTQASFVRGISFQLESYGFPNGLRISDPAVNIKLECDIQPSIQTFLVKGQEGRDGKTQMVPKPTPHIQAHWSGRNIPGIALCPVDSLMTGFSLNLPDTKKLIPTCVYVLELPGERETYKQDIQLASLSIPDGAKGDLRGEWSEPSDCRSDPEHYFVSALWGQYDSSGERKLRFGVDCGGTDLYLPTEFPTIVQPYQDVERNPLRAAFIQPLSKEKLQFYLIFQGEDAWSLKGSLPFPVVSYDPVASEIYAAHTYKCYGRTSDVEEFQLAMDSNQDPQTIYMESPSGTQSFSHSESHITFPTGLFDGVSVNVYDDSLTKPTVPYGDIFVNTPNHLMSTSNNNTNLWGTLEEKPHNYYKWQDTGYEVFFGGDAEAELYAKTNLPDRSKDIWVKAVAAWSCD